MTGRITMRLLAPLALAALASPVVPYFSDVTRESKIGYVSQPGKTPEKFLLESMGGGVGLIDADGDGLLDVYFVNGAALAVNGAALAKGAAPDKSAERFWNRLYRNNGDGTFTDITVKAGVRGAGYGQGVAVADFDNDGHADLYVTNFGANILYRNNGDGTFADVTAKAGVAGGGWSAGAGFIDYDRDGKLDLFVARYLDWDFPKNKPCGGAGPKLRAYCHPNEFAPVEHLLFRNKGDGTFEDVSRASGIAAHRGKGLGVAFHDFDRDGWPDIFVANDSFPQQLFRNKGDGTFEETALDAGLAYDDDGNVFAGMGTDAADYDNDGWPDVFANALANQRYALFRNVKGAFEYVSGASGVAAATKMHSGWGTKFVDFDNDGWRDLFVAQGHVMDNIELTQPSFRYREPFLLLKNVNGRFTDTRAFDRPVAARGAAFGDLDGDGAIDVVVSSVDAGPVVLRNQSKGNHWLLVQLQGTESNRDGIGAAVRIVSASGKEQHAFVSAASSYLSASDRRVHFGLGADASVKEIEIRWPSGIAQRWSDVAADQVFAAKESR